ncbi:hypothetical protein [Streptomyces sp. or3]|uniref:hypothetical protein n=1 Tax=Streptomyces sp. or3 TaxID=1828020 RepID=UPI000BFB98A5|nr:hypothetical protein [Streptomyces sp. or3]
MITWLSKQAIKLNDALLGEPLGLEALSPADRADVVVVDDPLGELLEEVSMSVLAGVGFDGAASWPAGRGRAWPSGGLVSSKAWMRWPMVPGVAAWPTQRPVVVKTGTSSRSASNTRT